jgi:SET domain-containing protein
MKFIEDLKREVYCRLAPSCIHGVGVVAIRDIPKGINPMRETRKSVFHSIPVRAIQQSEHISDAVKQLAKDMCPQEGDVYLVPNYSLNEIGISYYLNHSNTPNMEERDGDFYTLNEIKAGQELTVNYSSYGELNL